MERRSEPSRLGDSSMGGSSRLSPLRRPGQRTLASRAWPIGAPAAGQVALLAVAAMQFRRPARARTKSKAGRLITATGVGHMIPIEAPQVVTDAVTSTGS